MTVYEAVSIDHTDIARHTKPAASWKKQAACRGLSHVMDDEDTAPALAICRACPVEQTCVRWVMSLTEAQDPGGVCGGTTQHRRKLLRLKRNRR